MVCGLRGSSENTIFPEVLATDLPPLTLRNGGGRGSTHVANIEGKIVSLCVTKITI